MYLLCKTEKKVEPAHRLPWWAACDIAGQICPFNTRRHRFSVACEPIRFIDYWVSCPSEYHMVLIFRDRTPSPITWQTTSQENWVACTIKTRTGATAALSSKCPCQKPSTVSAVEPTGLKRDGHGSTNGTDAVKTAVGCPNPPTNQTTQTTQNQTRMSMGPNPFTGNDPCIHTPHSLPLQPFPQKV